LEKYANVCGESGSSLYTIGSQYSKVRFSSGSNYQYSYSKAGESQVENIKTLALDCNHTLIYMPNLNMTKIDNLQSTFLLW
jgi:hypothetical protein